MVAAAVVGGLSPEQRQALQHSADLVLDWESSHRNAIVATSAIEKACGPLPPVPLDLIDIAAGIYLTDIAIPRGRNEQFVRSIKLHIPVREPARWDAARPQLEALLYLLTGDRFAVRFHQRHGEASCVQSRRQVEPGDFDCVCLLSGGLDSLAAAVGLLRSGRKPLLLSHASGNPTVARAQAASVASLRRAWGQVGHLTVHVHPRTTPAALPFPQPERREPTRRSRSLLFMSLAAVVAASLGSIEVYMGENGVLTAAVPLSPGRAGALSTRTTHPAVLNSFNSIVQSVGMSVRVINPFVYQTKAELLLHVLRPSLRVEEIQRTVSCWMVGRRHRQCGGCVPCLLRRLSMLAAGLPDEAYEMDLLAQPEQYRGTDAYINVVDLLSYVAELQRWSEVDLLLRCPALLDLAAHQVSVPDIVSMLKRFAGEVAEAVLERFPAAARLMVGAEA